MAQRWPSWNLAVYPLLEIEEPLAVEGADRRPLGQSLVRVLLAGPLTTRSLLKTGWPSRPGKQHRRREVVE